MECRVCRCVECRESATHVPQESTSTASAHWAEPLNPEFSSYVPIDSWKACHQAALLTSACADTLQLALSVLQPDAVSAGRLSTAASQALSIACILTPLAVAPRCSKLKLFSCCSSPFDCTKVCNSRATLVLLIKSSVPHNRNLLCVYKQSDT